MTNPSRFWRDYLPLAVWLAVIFYASTSAGSSAHTLHFVTRTIGFLFGGSIGAVTLETIDFWVRKTGHVSEYAILGVLFFRAYRPNGVGWAIRVAALAWASAALYAATDEWHQAFVPGRTSSACDVLIDSCGAAIGLLLLKMRTSPAKQPEAALATGGA